MKGDIFGQAFYTKRAAFHRKKPAYIMSANGQKKGFLMDANGNLTPASNQRLALTKTAHAVASGGNATGTVTFRGAKMPRMAALVAENGQQYGLYGDKVSPNQKAADRESKKRATGELIASLESHSSRGMVASGNNFSMR